jgi:S-adenosylmethionine:tRNA-ribosyltransferase-isomerase (queuine synthetase)
VGPPIDILINNASTLGHIPLRPLLDTECESFEIPERTFQKIRETKNNGGRIIAVGTSVVRASESHYSLIGAFIRPASLKRTSEHLERRRYLTHEFGDSCLIFKESKKCENLEHEVL